MNIDNTFDYKKWDSLSINNKMQFFIQTYPFYYLLQKQVFINACNLPFSELSIITQNRIIIEFS